MEVVSQEVNVRTGSESMPCHIARPTSGGPYPALVVVMEAFLATRNLLTLFLCVPIHSVCALLCARDARFFALIRTQGYAQHMEHLQEPCQGVIRWAGGDARREP